MITSVVTQLPRAHASFTYQLAANGSITYTDNISNAPDVEDMNDDEPTVAAGGLGRRWGMMYMLTPSISLIYERPRGNVQVGYSRSFAHATVRSVEQSGSDALNVAAMYELSPLDNINLVANATNSSFTGLLFEAGTPEAINGVQTSGMAQLLRINAGESLMHQWSERWSSTQSLNVGAQANMSNDDVPTNWIIGNSLGTTGEFGYNSFGLLLALSSMNLAGSQLLAERDDDWAHIVNATLTWSRELGPSTSGSVQAGASQRLRDATVHAVGGLNLQHETTFVTFTAGASRTQTPDLQTANIFVSDTAFVGASSRPFQQHPLAFNVYAGVSQRQAPSSQGDEDASIDSVDASAGLRWIQDFFSASLNYTFLRQTGAQIGPFTIPGLTRNAVTLTIGGQYP